LQARHNEEREQWVRRLEDTIRRHANRSRLWDSQSAFYIAGGYTKEGGGSGTGGRRPNHLELVARRVSEADAYLQLMIEQTNVSIVPRNAGIMQFIVIFSCSLSCPVTGQTHRGADRSGGAV